MVDALAELFDGATRFGWVALTSVHLHLVWWGWRLARRLRHAEGLAQEAAREVEALPCSTHAERMASLEDAHARLSPRP